MSIYRKFVKLHLALKPYLYSMMMKGHEMKEEDEVVALIPARSLDSMLFFSDKGKVYSEKVYQIPDADRTSKGIPLVNILALGPNERVTAAIAVPSSRTLN